MYKSITNAVKDIDSKNRVVTGYLSNFGNKDHDQDIIEKGAFTKTISERKDDIFFLYQHDWQKPLSKFAVLEEDAKGLYFESMPLPDTTFANDLIKLYQEGIVKEHSIGFNTVKGYYDNDRKAYIMKEVKLFEGSAVTLGANSLTPFTGFKSYTMKDVNDDIKKITKAYRNGSFSDETFGLLEVALRQLQEKAFELGKDSLNKEPNPSELDNEAKAKSMLEEQKQIINNFIKNY